VIAVSTPGARTIPDDPGNQIAAHPYRLFGGYRLTLAVMVLLSHSPGFLPKGVSQLSLGNAGVFSFFVLSGFVIAEALDVFYRGNIKGFLANRFLKIYPTFWAASIFAYVVLVYLGRSDFPPNPLMVVVNLTILFGHLPFGSQLVLLTLAWAVIVELIFYILMAVVSTLGTRISCSKEVLVLAAVVALGAYLYVDYTESFTRSFAVFRFSPFFIAGVAYYYVVSRRSMSAAVLLVIAFGAAVHSYWVYNQPPTELLRVARTVLFVSVNIGFAWMAWLRCPPAVEKADKRMGDLTYGVYLCHMPVIWLVAVFSFIPSIESLLVIACSFALAGLIFICVERPMFRLRDKFRGARLYD